MKKITDPTNVAIKYNYDAAGRIGSIVGEGTLYGGVSQYVTGTSYRAWGGIKAVTYGNNYTSAVSYNSRLQGTLFEVAGRPAQFGGSTVMKTQYQYYADGSLKYAENQQDERFDRAYGYDHTARVKEAYSGSESRDYVNGTNSGTQTGPYRQSYQHDAFGNMTSLNTRFWTRSDGFTASYTNNRRQGFSYDADGRLTADSDLQYGYNAAGRNVSVFSAAQNRTIDSVHDGNGWLTKRTESVGSTVTNTTYYLRSSVLGGRVVTELNQTGQKQKGYVYAGDQVVAEQENNVVSWKYTAPLTGSRGGALADGQFSGEAEFDPMGVNVGFANLFFEPLSGPAPEPFQPMLIGDQSGCGGNPNCTRCSLDGLEISCNEAMHLLDTGAAELQVTLSNGQRITVPVQSYGLGIFRAWVPSSFSDHPGLHPGADPITGEPVDVSSATETDGHWETFSFNFAPATSRRRHHPEPQEPLRQLSSTETSSLIDDIFKLFKDHPGCEDWTNKALGEMSNSSGFNAGSIKEILENFRKSGTIYTRGAVNGTGGGSAGTGIGGRPTVSLTYGTTAEWTAVALMHEITHWAGMVSKSGGGFTNHYTDGALATAWHNLGVVISADEYKSRYPKFASYAQSKLAGAGNDITCMDTKPLVRTLK